MKGFIKLETCFDPLILTLQGDKCSEIRTPPVFWTFYKLRFYFWNICVTKTWFSSLDRTYTPHNVPALCIYSGCLLSPWWRNVIRIARGGGESDAFLWFRHYQVLTRVCAPYMLIFMGVYSHYFAYHHLESTIKDIWFFNASICECNFPLWHNFSPACVPPTTVMLEAGRWLVAALRRWARP